MDVIKTNIDQDAASLGAAAVCARAVGLRNDYSFVPALHRIEHRCQPDPETHKQYEKLLEVFRYVSVTAADLGDLMKEKLQ